MGGSIVVGKFTCALAGVGNGRSSEDSEDAFISAATTMPKSEGSLDFSSASSDSSYDSEEEYRLAQQEWEESLNQLQQLISVVLMPFIGKWLGRRWSYWGKSEGLYGLQYCI